MHSAQFINQFIAGPEYYDTPLSLLTVQAIKPLPTWDIREELVIAFSRIYNSSEAFDLGRIPSRDSYAGDVMMAAVGAVATMMNGTQVPSLKERAYAVHSAWAHAYLVHKAAGSACERDGLLVPFDQLASFERKKRYFAAELIPLIVAGFPSNPLQERVYAAIALEAATYHVAYEMLQDVYPDILNAHDLIETDDAMMPSPSTLY